MNKKLLALVIFSVALNVVTTTILTLHIQALRSTDDSLSQSIFRQLLEINELKAKE